MRWAANVTEPADRMVARMTPATDSSRTRKRLAQWQNRIIRRREGDVRFFAHSSVSRLSEIDPTQLHVEPGNCYAGASYFVTQPEPLGRIRDGLVARFEAWQAIVEGAETRKVFPEGVESPSSLKRALRGYDPDHPAAEYLRMKGFGLHHRITDRALVDNGGLDVVLEAMRAARPFVDFVNTAIAGRT